MNKVLKWCMITSARMEAEKEKRRLNSKIKRGRFPIAENLWTQEQSDWIMIQIGKQKLTITKSFMDTLKDRPMGTEKKVKDLCEHYRSEGWDVRWTGEVYYAERILMCGTREVVMLGDYDE